MIGRNYILSEAVAAALLLGVAGCQRTQIRVPLTRSVNAIYSETVKDAIAANISSKLAKGEFIYDCNDYQNRDIYGDNLNKDIFEQLMEQDLPFIDHPGLAGQLVGDIKDKIFQESNLEIIPGFEHNYIIMGPPSNYEGKFHYAVSAKARSDINEFYKFIWQAANHIKPVFLDEKVDSNRLRPIIKQYISYNNKDLNGLKGEHLEIRKETVIGILYDVINSSLNTKDEGRASEKNKIELKIINLLGNLEMSKTRHSCPFCSI